MLTKRFDTPFGYFEVLHNGKNTAFSVEEGTYDTYSLDEEVSVHPDGCYLIAVDIINMKQGDVVTARYSVPGLRDDGGGEDTLNALAELESYVIGIGCEDTDDLECKWNTYLKDEYAGDRASRMKKMFPYSFLGITKATDGFEFRITDDPRKYLQYSDAEHYGNRTVIRLSLVWNKREDEYAREIVSFLTC